MGVRLRLYKLPDKSPRLNPIAKTRKIAEASDRRSEFDVEPPPIDGILSVSDRQQLLVEGTQHAVLRIDGSIDTASLTTSQNANLRVTLRD